MNNWLDDITYNRNKAIFYLTTHLASNVQILFMMNNENCNKGH